MIELKKAGIIGIGLLGSAISERLLGVGLVVWGYDSNARQLKSFASHGGLAGKDAAEVIRNSQLVILSLPSSETVSAVVGQLKPVFQPRQIVIDTTTGEPEQMIANGQLLAEIGVDYIEASVAGSSAQMRAGQATLFIGGGAAVVDQIKPILDKLSDQSFYLGSAGSASRMKLVHNMILGLHRAVLAEGLMFAKALGIEPGEALRMLRQTPAASAVMETKGKRMVSGDFSPQARLSQHLKDVRLILAASQRAHCKTPLSELHQRLLETAEQLGCGELDNSAIVQVFRRPAESDP